MELKLNGKVIILDKDEVHTKPSTASARWLELYGKEKEMERELKDYTGEELYDFKDRLKAIRVCGRGPGQTYQRQYKTIMLAKVNAELERRGLRLTRPGDRRVYGPGRARFQQAGEAAA